LSLYSSFNQKDLQQQQRTLYHYLGRISSLTIIIPNLTPCLFPKWIGLEETEEQRLVV